MILQPDAEGHLPLSLNASVKKAYDLERTQASSAQQACHNSGKPEGKKE